MYTIPLLYGHTILLQTYALYILPAASMGLYLLLGDSWMCYASEKAAMVAHLGLCQTLLRVDTRRSVI